MINGGLIELRKFIQISTPADIHTKNLTGKVFKNHRGKVVYGFGGKAANIHLHMSEYD